MLSWHANIVPIIARCIPKLKYVYLFRKLRIVLNEFHRQLELPSKIVAKFLILIPG